MPHDPLRSVERCGAAPATSAVALARSIEGTAADLPLIQPWLISCVAVVASTKLLSRGMREPPGPGHGVFS